MRLGQRQARTRMSRLTYGADQVARLFLSITDPEDNDVSNLKLQKLCYYAQGLCTAMRGAPLFRDRIEAWDHGPVVPGLYRQYKHYGSQPIPAVTDFNQADLDPADRQALSDIYEYYAQFSAWRLRNMTHEEGPGSTLPSAPTRKSPYRRSLNISASPWTTITPGGSTARGRLKKCNEKAKQLRSSPQTRSTRMGSRELEIAPAASEESR
jgi:uncharacterized phage-associated protein